MKILIIEDDKDIAEMLEYNFKQEHFEVAAIGSGLEGLKKAKKWLPDLIILDLMLPDMGGINVCRVLKSEEDTQNIPVIILTAKGEEIDKVVGFEVGAEDYMTKPFSPRELMLRSKALLRRVKKKKVPLNSSVTYSFGNLKVDPDKFEVLVGKTDVKLTAVEFRLLEFLLANKGRVATRDVLLDKVWGYDAELTTRTVDTHIKRLRQKLLSAGDYIETIRGVGYKFKEKP
ncbi:response regulator transcription factor [bacterium]|nr:response regulator transcription factor [bacterium]